MSESPASPTAPDGPELGIVARLTGVFFSPAQTFASIARKPGWDWLVPVILLMAASFIAQSVLLPKMDVDDAVKTQMKFIDKMSKGSIPEAKRAEIEQKTREGMEAGTRPVRRVLNTLIFVVFILFVPAVYHGIAAAFGTKTSYLRVLSGYAYTQVIQTIPILLTAAVAWPRDKLDLNDIQFQRVLKSNVAAFLDFDTTSKVLLAVTSSIDVFDIWTFVVGSIALSKTTRFSSSAARYVVGGVWLTYILIKVACGGLYAAFMG